VPQKQNLGQALLDFGLNNYWTIIFVICGLTIIATILIYGGEQVE
jgi:hypothetical protein